MSRAFLKSTFMASVIAFAAAIPANAAETIEDWAAKARNEIIENNFYPRGAIEQGIEGKVTVRFDIAKSGLVKGVQILEPSGSDVLDQQAFRLAAKLAKLPSLPEGIEEHSITVPFNFEIKDSREKIVSERTDIHAYTRLG